MITLYHAPQSRSSRIIWLLEELGLPYEICPVSIFRPMTGLGMADPANPHPDKRVPAILHDGVLVAESVAIILYLTEAYPRAGIGPEAGAPGRGDYLTWLAWYAAELEPVMLAQMAGEVAGSTEKRRSYDLVLRRIETALAKSPYLMGEAFTGADLLISSALAFGRDVFPESEVLDAFIARCRMRPAALRALALDTASGIQKPA
ncbi:MAG: glutathione S-transferase family protein [Sphingomonadales bacterium]|nr:MAG: glutathione S-transferase family protein [Sphingomonadales bacterium]TNF02612.1 MAG: glutathione S-transferase family protein [Sphingomonadales bacterium]